MTALVLGLVGAGAVICLAFVVLYAFRSPWRSTPMGRHLMMFMTVTTAGLFALLGLGLKIPIPLWVWAIGFFLFDVAAARQVWLLWQAQKDPGEEGL